MFDAKWVTYLGRELWVGLWCDFSIGRLSLLGTLDHYIGFPKLAVLRKLCDVYNFTAIVFSLCVWFSFSSSRLETSVLFVIQDSGVVGMV